MKRIIAAMALIVLSNGCSPLMDVLMLLELGKADFSKKISIAEYLDMK